MARRLTTMTGNSKSVRKALGLAESPTPEETAERVAAESTEHVEVGSATASVDKLAPATEETDEQKAEREAADAEEARVAAEAAEQKSAEELAAEEAAADTAGAEGEENQPPRKAKRGDLQSRLDELSADKRLLRDQVDAKERENAALKAKLDARAKDEEAEAARKAAEPDPDETPVAKPNREDFETYEAYDDAREEYLLTEGERRGRMAAKKLLSERDGTSTEAKAKAEQVASEKRHIELVAATRAARPDFDAVMDTAKGRTDIPWNAGIQTAMGESDERGEIMYRLAKDQKEWERIAKLSPARAAAAIVTLSDAITAERKKAGPKKVARAVEGETEVSETRISRAPAPTSQPAGRARSTHFDRKHTKDFKAYRAARTAEEAALNGGRV
jgi:hypothetical protein